MEVGAGTSHTATFLRALGPEPWRAAYVQPSRRPKDGRYGENPNRLHQHSPVPGRAEALAAGHPRSLPRFARSARLRPEEERRALRRGRLGKPDARRVGPGLGSVDERHGNHAVHLFPAGRRPRLQSDHRRNHLRPRADVDVPAERRVGLRPRSIRDSDVLSRRVLPERGRAVEIRLRRSPTRPSCSSSSRSSSPRRGACWRRSCRCRATR